MNDYNLKIKKIEDISTEKYKINSTYTNPYYKKHGARTKSYFSVTESKVFDDEEEDCYNKGEIILEEEINSETSLKDFDEIEQNLENTKNNKGGPKEFLKGGVHDFENSGNFDDLENMKNNKGGPKDILKGGPHEKIGIKRRVSFFEEGEKIDGVVVDKKKSFLEKRKTSEILEYSKVKEMMKNVDLEGDKE